MLNRTKLVTVVAGLPCAAVAQPCGVIAGPDLTITGMNTVVNYAADGVRDAFSVGADQTNIGSVAVNYFGTSSAHPVLGQALYRLRTVQSATRLEQIGMSWFFHGFTPLQGSTVCGTCVGGDPNRLGIGCTSTDTASRMGSQPGLGPRWQVNPATGTLAFPHANPPYSGTVARRLQAKLEELDTTSSYFVEVMCVAADDALAGNSGNNASYRACTMGGGPSDYTMSLAAPAFSGVAAIDAWRRADPIVLPEAMPVPGDGWILMAR